MINIKSSIYVLLCSIVMANLPVLPVQAVDVDALEAEIKVLEGEKSTLQTKLNKLNTEISTKNKSVEELEEKNDELSATISTIIDEAFEYYDSIQIKPLETQKLMEPRDFIDKIVAIKSIPTLNNQTYSINDIFSEQKAILVEFWEEKKEAQEAQVSNNIEINSIQESKEVLESDKASLTKEISTKTSKISTNYNKINATKYTQENSNTSSGSGTAQEVVNYALQFIGTPYKLGGTSLTSGIDCSRFVQAVYAKYGYSLPNTTVYQINSGKSVSYSNAVAGDLIFYSGHVGLYIGSGKIVHASVSSGVKISSATYTTIVAVRRIIN